MKTGSHSGIYVHIPFCISRCAYCAFISLPYDKQVVHDYVGLVVREIQLWSQRQGALFLPSNPVFDSIYFGGGTPSLLVPSEIERIIGACYRSSVIAPSPEITIEINPNSCNLPWLTDVKGLGVNRISLGLQSCDDRELKLLGRPHNAQSALKTYEDIRKAGFENVSVDLIAGFPRHTMASFTKSVEGVVELKPEHISIYLFELKSGSKMDSLIKAGKEHLIDEDLAADMYELLCGKLDAAGYIQYEISNFCREDFVCRHNIKYWEDKVYVGVGLGAHGMTGHHRYANWEDLGVYGQTIARNRLPMRHVSEMTEFDRFRDALMLGSRLVKGVNLRLLSERYHVDAEAYVRDSLAELDGLELFTIEEDIFSLTARGRLLSNQIFSRWV
jgi:oxygen-independent coproporphyrinogen III oxidase